MENQPRYTVPAHIAQGAGPVRVPTHPVKGFPKAFSVFTRHLGVVDPDVKAMFGA